MTKRRDEHDRTVPEAAAPQETHKVLHPLRGWAAAVLLPLAAILFAAWFIDPAVLPAARGEVGGALALRDRVDETEILLTWTFAEPRLEAAYAEVACITRERRGFLEPGDEEDAFVATLTELATRHAFLDLYLLAHTNEIVEIVAALPDALRAKVRMVYNSGCECGQQAQRWHEAGVEAYVAHPSSASHAGFFVCFLRRWPGGRRLADVVAEANAAQDRLFEHLAALDVSFAWAREHWVESRAEVHGRGDLVLAGSEEASR